MKAPTDTEKAVYGVLKKKLRENGTISDADVRRASKWLGVRPRSVRRRIATEIARELAGQELCQREPFTPSQDHIEALAMFDGNVAATFDYLEKSGEKPGISLRTFQRGFRDRYDRVQIAGMRGGLKGFQAALPTVPKLVPYRAHSYAVDHSLAPFYVRLERSKQIVKPWMTTVEDERHRLTLAGTLSPQRPTTEELVETLAAAVEGCLVDGIYIGGVPEYVLSDRGADMASRAMTLGLVASGSGRRFTAPYSAWQNGRLERYHRTIKKGRLKRIPGSDRSDWADNRDPRAPDYEPDPSECLPLKVAGAMLIEDINDYNHTTHSELGMSPLESWAQDPTPLQRAEPAAIRAAMTQRTTRVVDRGLIKWNRKKYADPDSLLPRNYNGERVEIAYLDARPEFVDVYQNGNFVCRAWDTKYKNAELAAQAAAYRRSSYATFAINQEAADQLRAEVRKTELAKIHDAESEDAPGTTTETEVPEELTPPAQLPAADSPLRRLAETMGELLNAAEDDDDPSGGAA